MAALAPGTVQLNIFCMESEAYKICEGGQPKKAMQLFEQMQLEGMTPDKFTFVQVIKACA